MSKITDIATPKKSRVKRTLVRTGIAVAILAAAGTALTASRKTVFNEEANAA